MSTSSWLSTIYGKDVKMNSPEEFNEAIMNNFDFDWDEASDVIDDTNGNEVPFVAEIKDDKFYFMGYEAEAPTNYPYMYGNFNINYARVIANNIVSGVMILSHKIEGDETEFYYIEPGKVTKIDITQAILDFMK